mmetsp:Transcript_17605/g.46788  ORF Transcript_17605/g.46788 Transcript_17605/m.46788 type:complete len:239 (+) Transcript_17605:207-923(+)
MPGIPLRRLRLRRRRSLGGRRGLLPLLLELAGPLAPLLDAPLHLGRQPAAGCQGPGGLGVGRRRRRWRGRLAGRGVLAHAAAEAKHVLLLVWHRPRRLGRLRHFSNVDWLVCVESSTKSKDVLLVVSAEGRLLARALPGLGLLPPLLDCPQRLHVQPALGRRGGPRGTIGGGRRRRGRCLGGLLLLDLQRALAVRGDPLPGLLRQLRRSFAGPFGAVGSLPLRSLVLVPQHVQPLARV